MPASLIKVTEEDEIYITGMSGRFPESDNIEIFYQNLFHKKDLITSDTRRWNVKHPDIPPRSGKINHIDTFDEGYFDIFSNFEITNFDSQNRILLETVYEAIVDAGINPIELKGSRMGTFIGTTMVEASFVKDSLIYGKSFNATAVNYWLGTSGPACVLDTACSSSLTALEAAYTAIRQGLCDSAIVAGSNLCLAPTITLQFSRLGVLSAKGMCRPFDDNASGYVRSEAISAIFLQKEKNAKRIYARLVHSKNNSDGFKQQGITYPSDEKQFELLDTFYKECNVDPLSLVFLEAHGTGTVVGDPVELGVIDQMYSKTKEDPFLIGSVKGNVGHCEASSGMCSLVKVLLSYTKGYLLPNINYTKPRSEVKCLEEGTIKVLTEPTKFEGGLIGINSFGFGGSNSHALLEGYKKKKIDGGIPKDDVPRLICVSGRTEEAVNLLLNYLESHEVDVEFVRLLHEIFKTDIHNHEYRGYILLQKGGPKVLSRNNKRTDGSKKPLCFVFSGSSAHRSIDALMQIPVFEKTITRCQKILDSQGVNLKAILVDDQSHISRIVFQIGVLTVLSDIGIVPDYVAGQSWHGELICAYVDGCLTFEQTLLVAYFIEQALMATEKLKSNGEIHNNQIKNNNKSVFENGFTNNQELKSKNVNKSIPSKHTKAQQLLENLRSVVPNSKQRNKKWLSHIPIRHITAEYFADIIDKTEIPFKQLLKIVPVNTLCIEMSPKQLRKAPIDTRHEIISFMQKDVVESLLTTIGRLYEFGITPELHKLYPHVSFPVSVNTAPISPLIGWNHSTKWPTNDYYEVCNSEEKSYENLLDISMDFTYSSIHGHVIDGRSLFPATGYLVVVWNTMAQINSDIVHSKGIVFKNVKFLRATNITDNLKFLITIQPGTGKFEVCEGNALVVTGEITKYGDVSEEMTKVPPFDESKYKMELKQSDVYKELHLRGYNYKDVFRSIEECEVDGTVGKICWNDWISFMDNMLQLLILREDNRGLFVPTRLKKIVIDPDRQANIFEKNEKKEEYAGRSKTLIPARVYKNLNLVQAGGVEIQGLYATAIAKRKPLADPVLETYQFVPYRVEDVVKITDVVRNSVHLILENAANRSFKCVEEDGDIEPLAPIVRSALGDLPLIQPDITVLSQRTFDFELVKVENKSLSAETGCSLIVGSNWLHDPEKLDNAKKSLSKGGFILTREKNTTSTTEPIENFDIVLERNCETEKLVLIKPSERRKPFTTLKISDKTGEPFEWLETLKNEIKNEKPLLLFTEKEPLCGIQGLVNCIRNEPGGENVHCVFIIDEKAPPFDSSDPFYKKQLDLNLAMNVYKNGLWGSFRHLQLAASENVLTKHAFVNVATRGDLSSLRWFQGRLSNQTSEPITEVYYAALNFRDVMTATGKLATEVVAHDRFQETVQGIEFSGRKASGQRIMGMLSGGALATQLQEDPYLTWDVPDDWTLEDAATVPIVYGTALYALICIGEMHKGQSVLIHAGSGGVGQAAINVALHYGCTVFTTVGTLEKRNFIKERFPQLNDSHIGNSRNLSFEQMIMRETNGRGVDLVLNSLAEEKLQASVRCLAPNGRFLEIGKFDLANDNTLGIGAFSDGKSFHGVMLDNLFYAAPKEKKELHVMLEKSIKEGAVRPLTRTVFNEDQIEQAFRYMATGKHIGKVLIKVRDEEKERIKNPESRLISAHPRIYCDPLKSYIIAGGLGGFGLELADWLITRGAKKLILTSRKGISKGYQKLRISGWQRHGVQTVISTDDITTLHGCETLIKRANKLGPVGGIFNLAVVLQDAILENQTVEKFTASFGPKAFATKHLDAVSRNLCSEIEHFVIFSSVSCGRGNAGQTNYGMANSVMERICEKRRIDGLPGLAIQWGAVGDVGLVADMQEHNEELVIGGTLPQRIANCLELLDVLLKQETPIVSSMIVAEKKTIKKGATIVETVFNILGIKNVKLVSLNSTLSELGVDSMMTNEIKESLARDYEIFLSNEEIQALTLNRLNEIESSSKIESSNKTESAEQTGLEEAFRFKPLSTLVSGSIEEFVKPVVSLKSLAQPEDDVPTVIAIPGIEGYATIFESLAKKLNVHFYVLQLISVSDIYTVEQKIRHMFEIIKREFSDRRPITILAFSYGTTYGLGLMKLLEEESIECNMCLIDGSPIILKEFAMLKYNFEDTLGFENDILCDILQYFYQGKNIDIKGSLRKIEDLSDRFEFIFKLLSLNTLQEKTLFKKTYSYFHNCLKTLYELDYSTVYKKIKSPAVLIRQKHKIISNVGEDLGISQYTIEPIPLVFIDSTHSEIINTDQCAVEVSNFIQKHSRLQNKTQFASKISKTDKLHTDEKTI